MEAGTIAAIATAPGESGIAVVRVSGPEALRIADAVFQSSGTLGSLDGGRFIHGRVVGRDGPELDEAIGLVYRAPHSYTGEDVVEIQCHGGRVAVRRVLRALLDAGARHAGPGEFTRRAFINGRMDLAQAEAVADLIRARSDRAASAAIEQLEGRLSAEVDRLHDRLMSLAADVEATLDFAGDELPEDPSEGHSQRLGEILEGLNRLLSTWGEGHVLRDGALVVISGRPNAGKSTLMNTLLGRNRAIVDHEPGTTRDTLEEEMALDGIPLRLVDTAGLREPAERVEREGVERARAALERADVVLYIVDAAAANAPEELASLLSFQWRACVVVLNKLDLGGRVSCKDVTRFPCVACSLKEGWGVSEIKTAVLDALGMGGCYEPHAAISERHREALLAAVRELEAAVSLEDRFPDPALTAWHLRRAADEMGTITGRDYSEELLDRVFSRFCIGK
jgi:tRNA modification GTPase